MRKSIFFILLLMNFCFPAAYGAGYVCDFDADNSANDNDLIIMLAYLQTKGLAEVGIGSLDISTVQTSARNLLGNQSLTVARLPDSNDDLENLSTAEVGDNDLIIFLAYLQTKGLAEVGIGTLNFSSVEDSASQLLSKTVGLGKFPETPIGTASFTTTITGITTDP
jgi:hypothetical protein